MLAGYVRHVVNHGRPYHVRLEDTPYGFGSAPSSLTVVRVELECTPTPIPASYGI